MPTPAIERPSAPALATAAIVLLAAVFVRCSGTTPGPAASPEAGRSTAPEAQPEASAAPAAASTEASSAPAASAGEAAPERKRYAVAALGDSLTDARSSGGKYLAYLQKRCPDSRFENFGKGGDMVNQIRRRFEADVLPNGHDYTHLIVFGGVNDLYSDLTAGRTPEKISADLSAIYAAAHERKWQIVALTVAPWGGFTKYYNPKRAGSTKVLNAWISAQLATKKVDHVIDAFSLLSCGDAERLCPEFAKPMHDGLHFGPSGHAKLGAALFEAVFSDCR